MTILRFTWKSESRGGRHGEASTSNDEKKDQQEGDRFEKAITVNNEGQVQLEEQSESRNEDRQSHPSHKQTPEEFAEEEVSRMKDETLPPKAKAAKALGSMFNDPRITNVLMLVLVLIGMQI